jgi:hypothetical protein
MQRRHAAAETGVVAQDVEPAESLLCSGNHRLDIAFAGDIAVDADSYRLVATSAMRGIDRCCDRILIAADISEHQPRAFGRE